MVIGSVKCTHPQYVSGTISAPFPIRPALFFSYFHPVIKCIKCNEVSGIAKAGQVRGKQRYYCKHCNYYFTLQSAPPVSISSKHHATILDIAGRLKISKSTVSRALRNSNEINQETRNAVLKMAQELNYVPNYFASSLV